MDQELLAAARSARLHLDGALESAATARASFEDAIRALHRSGASMRAIAAELGISHQRVHQIVATGPGRPRFRGGSKPLVCSFCGRSELVVSRLIAGPGIFICDECVHDRHEESLTVGEGKGSSRPCRFCGKTPGQVAAVVGTKRNLICTECLGLCREILAEVG